MSEVVSSAFSTLLQLSREMSIKDPSWKSAGSEKVKGVIAENFELSLLETEVLTLVMGYSRAHFGVLAWGNLGSALLSQRLVQWVGGRSEDWKKRVQQTLFSLTGSVGEEVWDLELALQIGKNLAVLENEEEVFFGTVVFEGLDALPQIQLAKEEWLRHLEKDPLALFGWRLEALAPIPKMPMESFRRADLPCDFTGRDLACFCLLLFPLEGKGILGNPLPTSLGRIAKALENDEIRIEKGAGQSAISEFQRIRSQEKMRSKKWLEILVDLAREACSAGLIYETKKHSLQNPKQSHEKHSPQNSNHWYGLSQHGARVLRPYRRVMEAHLA